MKKILLVFFMLIAFTIFSVIILRTPNKVLYFLNWGEYIDRDLVKEFEKEYNCQVIEEDVTSSEIMYQKITSGTTSYDVAIPGDYCVRQLYEEGYLIKIDTDNVEYQYLNKYQTMFTDSLKKIMDDNMIVNGESIEKYYVPYFWGAYSIIYSTRKADVESVVLNNGFKALYDRSLYQEEVKIGMYDTARWIVASYLMGKNKNPNITKYSDTEIITAGDLSQEINDDVVSALKTTLFNEFGNDSLKRNVATGKLDMCFTQLGDFFDALYLVYEEGDGDKVDFNVSIPDYTAAFFDSMIIPTTSANVTLANKFINFMMNPANAYRNAQAIGYCPTLKEVCECYRNDALNGGYYYGDSETVGSLSLTDFLNKYPMYLDPLYKSTNVCLLEPKSNEYLTTCETIFNRLA